ncbi:hypothetical protein JRQ81_012148 [Phrynocephalus forsythii]|uniref:Uncharacterized protein n=1 Tax=Phrynocephalus forsythii TaxID=171643 RepID=A0A9Q0X5E5_9SAUR|nr:hypothetical protein JRQ81_012148 [Phrynocephalus forsythii]
MVWLGESPGSSGQLILENMEVTSQQNTGSKPRLISHMEENEEDLWLPDPEDWNGGKQMAFGKGWASEDLERAPYWALCHVIAEKESSCGPRLAICHEDILQS